ncbi:hemin uptake protein HemP [Leucothrix pacifica]|uniref:Hemin uptake protein HemP n=2 Tax=Leucothrix pacifica TaxID=1247513 RepID=A0A317C8U4_9GAMM|nr:hemin uptake protein HemP [Leucothrix pacifica]
MRTLPINTKSNTEMTESQLPFIDLKTIMANGKRVILKHGEKPYLLSITRRGKLILTAADDCKGSTPSQAT